MSTAQHLVLGSGPIRDRVGIVAAGVAIFGLFNRFNDAKTVGEKVEVVIEGVKIVTDLTPSQSDDELAAKIQKYAGSPEATALIEAGLAYYKSIRPAA